MVSKDRLTIIEEALANFQADRPVMEANNTPHALIKLLRTELDELEEALGTDQEAQEVSDVIIFAFTLAGKLGIDIHNEVMTKIAFNMARYQAKDLQEGDYDTQRKLCKTREAEIKKDFDTVKSL